MNEMFDKLVKTMLGEIEASMSSADNDFRSVMRDAQGPSKRYVVVTGGLGSNNYIRQALKNRVPQEVRLPVELVFHLESDG